MSCGNENDPPLSRSAYAFRRWFGRAAKVSTSSCSELFFSLFYTQFKAFSPFPSTPFPGRKRKTQLRTSVMYCLSASMLSKVKRYNVPIRFSHLGYQNLSASCCLRKRFVHLWYHANKKTIFRILVKVHLVKKWERKHPLCHNYGNLSVTLSS